MQSLGTDAVDDSQRYEIIDIHRLQAIDCSCGKTRRAFVEDPDRIASLHVVDIKAEANTHYHRHTTELYYVLEGQGTLELDGAAFPVAPGTAVLIKPGYRHRAVGQMRILNVPIPAFDPTDEWFDQDGPLAEMGGAPCTTHPGVLKLPRAHHSTPPVKMPHLVLG